MAYCTVDEAVEALISDSGEVSAHLVELVRLFGWKWGPKDGLPVLRDLTQRWIPRDFTRRMIKVPDLDLPRLEQRFDQDTRKRARALLEQLGFCQEFSRLRYCWYSHVIVHGSLPKHALRNLQFFCETASRHSCVLFGEILMLSAPYHVPAGQGVKDLGLNGQVAGKVNGRVIQHPLITEVVSMSQMWEDLPKPIALRNCQVSAISTCDSPSEHPRAKWTIIPNTWASLEAMWQCRFDPRANDIDYRQNGYKKENGNGHAYKVSCFPSNTIILVLAATPRQMIRQHVETRRFLKNRGVDCRIDSIVPSPDPDKPEWLCLGLIELAKAIWVRCEELGIEAK